MPLIRNYHQQLVKRIAAPFLAMMPLSISVLPWGILCGTLSIKAGLSGFQAQLMSLLVFAGAVQIAGISLLGAASSWLSLINSTTMISIRHVLYSASFHEHIIKLPFLKRVLFAFLLTDEMYAVAQAHQAKIHQFDYWYAVIAGFVFYVVWNIATFIGIHTANLLKNIDEMGLDFAIAATFIAMVIPLIRNKSIFFAVTVSASIALLCAYMGFSQGLIVSALLGMTVGAGLVRLG